jgi:hypothetical protein
MDERTQPAADQWTKPIRRAQRIDIRREVEELLRRSAGLQGQLSYIAAVFIISMIHGDRLFGPSKKTPASALKTGDFTRMHPSQSYPRRPIHEEYPGRFSDFRIFLLLAPSHPSTSSGQWLIASFVPEYSGGPVPDFSPQDGNHGVPFTWISFSIRPF